MQDVRLVRRAGALVDRTQLKNPTVKLNWQATKKDNVSFLFFDGFKIKDGRSPGVSGILFDAPTATFHQDNAYTDFPLHGLWKIGDDHTFGSNLFVSANYGYYNTGFILDPMGGLDMQAGRNFVTAQSYGSVSQGLNVRPQKVFNVNAQSFTTRKGASHDIKFGVGYRTTDAVAGTLWPGNSILANERAGNLQAQVFREGRGGNRANYLNFYVGDTIALSRVTIDVGVRFDRQDGEALPSETLANPAFPSVVPGIVFAGYKTPFTWNDFSPRAGVTYALDAERKTVARAELQPLRGSAQHRHGRRGQPEVRGWIGHLSMDRSQRGSLCAGERSEPQRVHFGGGRLQPGQPDGSDVGEHPRPRPEGAAHDQRRRRHGSRAGAKPAVTANYSYTKTTDLFGNFTGAITPRNGVGRGDYTPGSGFTGTLPDGTPYNVATWIPSATAIAAGNNGFMTTNVPGYFTHTTASRWASSSGSRTSG